MVRLHGPGGCLKYRRGEKAWMGESVEFFVTLTTVSGSTQSHWRKLVMLILKPCSRTNRMENAPAMTLRESNLHGAHSPTDYVSWNENHI